MANLKLWNIVNELKGPGYKWVDLTHELSPETPHWFGFKPLQGDLLFDYAEGTPELLGRWSCNGSHHCSGTGISSGSYR